MINDYPYHVPFPYQPFDRGLTNHLVKPHIVYIICWYCNVIPMHTNTNLWCNYYHCHSSRHTCDIVYYIVYKIILRPSPTQDFSCLLNKALNQSHFWRDNTMSTGWKRTKNQSHHQLYKYYNLLPRSIVSSFVPVFLF